MTPQHYPHRPLRKLTPGELGFEAPGLTDFSLKSVDIESLVHCTSNICRYGGRTKFHYSVAQHSILLSYAVPQHLKRCAIIHDLSEGLMGIDLPRPIKHMAEDVVKIEDHVSLTIFEAFGVDPELMDEFKEYDLAICIDEMTALMPFVDPKLYELGLTKLDVPIIKTAPDDVELHMWARIYDLFQQEHINELRNNRLQRSW
jgi:hypothetical protein